ncbi:hypothetical protein G6F40_018006 [Rhizopus arrhizus]|nr:hypothetical protein G6F40_018006 [Rhizopus arrhizus]
MRSMIGLGVPAGAIRPAQEPVTKPGMPASSIVGMPGSVGPRSLPVKASAFRRFCFTYCIGTRMGSNTIETRPPSRSVRMGALPL